MFKWKVYMYKDVNWKKEELSREFDNEKDFQKFIDKNPSLKELKDFPFKNIDWPESLADLRWFFSWALLEGKKDFVDEIEKDLKKVFEKSKKLLR